MKAEIVRQLIHVVLGACFIALLYFLPFDLAATFIGVVALLGLAFSLAIANRMVQPKRVLKLLHLVERPGELRKTGEPALWFVLGTSLTVLLFPVKEVAIGALIVLTIGDSVSTIVGRNRGKIVLKGWRTLEGSAAGIIAATVFLAPFFPLQTAFIGAFIGMLAEYLPINDNVTIPLAAAVALSAATFLSF